MPELPLAINHRLAVLEVFGRAVIGFRRWPIRSLNVVILVVITVWVKNEFMGRETALWMLSGGTGAAEYRYY